MQKSFRGYGLRKVQSSYKTRNITIKQHLTETYIKIAQSNTSIKTKQMSY